MSPSSVEVVEQRLARLERENRLLKVGVAVALAAMVVLLVGQTLPVKSARAENSGTLTAQRFEVRDEQGQIRGVLGLVPGGGVVMNLYGSPGAVEPTCSAGALRMYADPKQTTFSMDVGSDASKSGLEMGAATGEPGRLTVYDSSGKSLLSIPQDR